MRHIASLTFPSGASSGTVSFTSIPQIYQHLHLRMTVRGTQTGSNNGWMWIKVNSNSTASSHYTMGNGSVYDSYRYISTTPNLMVMPRAGAASNVFGIGILDFLDYTSTSKNKTVKALSGYDANGNGGVMISSLLATDTTAITSIELIPWDMTAFAQYSRFDLYGLPSTTFTGA